MSEVKQNESVSLWEKIVSRSWFLLNFENIRNERDNRYVKILSYFVFDSFCNAVLFFPENVLISYNLSTGVEMRSFEQTVLAPDIGPYIRGLFHTF